MSFHVVSGASVKDCVFEAAYIKSLLQKWDMLQGMQSLIVRYTKYYHKMAGVELACDLLNNSAIRGALKVMSKSGWQPFPCETITSVTAEPVPCTVTRMDLFDKLQNSSSQPPIIRPATGELVRRFDDVREGFQIQDNLRELLLCEESENAELISDQDKSQLLWRVFEHICLGGPCCQYEDKLDPYLEASKAIYKELVTVQKGPSGEIEVASTVFKITAVNTASGPVQLFPSNNRNSFMYLAIDPLRRLARIWYHAHVPYW